MRWLDPERWFPKRFLLDSTQPELEAYPVSNAIRDPQRDDYTLLEPVDALACNEELAMDEEDFDDEDS
jgi:putative SOS response-associated peptidase YedK